MFLPRKKKYLEETWSPGRMEVWNTAIQTQPPITVSLKGSFLEKHLSIQNLEGKAHWSTKRNLARLEALLFILSFLCCFWCHLVVYAPMKQSFMTSRTLALMIKKLGELNMCSSRLRPPYDCSTMVFRLRLRHSIGQDGSQRRAHL